MFESGPTGTTVWQAPPPNHAATPAAMRTFAIKQGKISQNRPRQPATADTPRKACRRLEIIAARLVAAQLFA